MLSLQGAILRSQLEQLTYSNSDDEANDEWCHEQRNNDTDDANDERELYPFTGLHFGRLYCPSPADV